MDLQAIKNNGTDAKNLRDLVKTFLFQSKTMSPDTLKTYASALDKWAKYMPENLADIRVESIEKYIMSITPKYKSSSVNLYINAIKSFFNWLESFGYPNLGQKINILSALPPDQRILTRSEYNIICATITGNDLDCFRFLCNTGLRVSEFVPLNRHNVVNNFLRVIGKGRRKRSIPCNQTVLEILNRHPGFEFIQRRNRLWVFRMCKRIGVQVGVAEFHPHSCRHYFANELYHNGVDMYTISRLLGHAATSVTENVYVHWSEEDLEGCTDILD